MKILVTGATGFVGTALIRKLLIEGHEVLITSRNPERARQSVPFPLSGVVAWDPVAGEPALSDLAGVEAVIHLAGESVAERWSAERKKAIQESRQLGTRHLMAALRKMPVPPKVVLSASAIGFYGDRGEEVLTETSAPGKGFLPGVCVDWEKELFDGAPATTRTAALRVGIVLGRGGGALQRLIPIFQNGAGGPVGSGKQWMSWIHLEDLVSLFVFALGEERVRGVMNAAGPSPVRNDEFSRELGRAMGKSAWVPAPAFAVRLAFGEMAAIVLSSQKVLPGRAQTLGFGFRFPDLAAALADLSVADEVLEVDQYLPRPVQEVWPFFCEAKNLEELTPPFLNFEVLGMSTPEVREGTLIDYRLKLHGIPLGWTSRIEEWQPGSRFVDTQVKGPYSLWHHTHTFHVMGKGTLMRDRVRYRVPAGALGRLAGGWKVGRDVGAIFAYRRRKVTERFGE